MSDRLEMQELHSPTASSGTTNCKSALREANRSGRQNVPTLISGCTVVGVAVAADASSRTTEPGVVSPHELPSPLLELPLPYRPQ